MQGALEVALRGRGFFGALGGAIGVFFEFAAAGLVFGEERGGGAESGGETAAGLFGGAVIVESIFAWNGIGRLTIEAVQRRDYTLIMGTTLMFAVLTVVANLLADVSYAIIDPRVRLD